MTARWTLLVVLGLSSVSWAGTLRLAVVIGNNAGDKSRPPLHFAEADAGRFARVLVELGGHSPDNVLLLQGRALRDVDAALAEATARTRRAHRGTGDRVLLSFYFSGHSDGTAIEMGRQKLPFAALIGKLEETAADVRLIIVDSCMSGALVGAKGATRGADFQVTLDDALTSKGHAMLASSAANELALESRELGGSFFTHHLISGLRGAADVSGDGKVTLTEAYQYAFARTVSTTSATFTGGQHPSYDYHLSGQGELVLADLSASQRTGWLELPEDFERALVTQVVRDQVVGELPPGAPRRMAVEPGAYIVRAWRDGAAFGRRVQVSGQGVRRVTWSELEPLAVVAQGKGGLPVLSTGPSLTLAGGARAGVAAGTGPLGALRAGVRFFKPWSLSLELEGAYGGAQQREWQLLAACSVRYVFDFAALRPFVGLELVGGGLFQRFPGAPTLWTLAAGGGAMLGAELELRERLGAFVQLNATVLAGRTDAGASAMFLPSASLGVRWSL